MDRNGKLDRTPAYNSTSETNHIKNSIRIIKYIKYLRDVSRKIASRNGFEKCYLNKQFKFAYPIFKYKDVISSLDAEYEMYNWYYEQVKSNPEKKLFIGFGLLCGSFKKRIISAPILYVQCDIDKSETNEITIEFPDNANINYDLLAALSDRANVNDEDVFTPSTINQTLLLEKLEDEINTYTSYEQIADFSRYVFNQLKIDFEEFKQVEIITTAIDYKNEVLTYLNNKTDSIFKGKLKYYPLNFAFVSTIPDQLSTYQALHSFVESIEINNEFKNPVLEKLLANALSEEKTSIGIIEEERINEIIENSIPLSLSASQKQAIKNAWQNEISYVQGPPGTGKSHTISALILSALALDKKVLVVSAKQPALEVVNQKINPLLSDDESVTGVIYFDKDSRRKIRDYISKLLNSTNSKPELTLQLQNIEENLNQLRIQIIAKQKKHKEYQNQLIQNINFQQEFKEMNVQFEKRLKRFANIFEKIPDKLPFKIIRDKAAYEHTNELVKKIYNSTQKTFAGQLYIAKYQKHLLEKFNLPKEWLYKSGFPLLSENYIELNAIYSETQKVRTKIKHDETSLRALIKELVNELYELKKDNIKLQFKHKLIQTLLDDTIIEDLEQFDKMLHWTNSKMVLKRMNEINFLNMTKLFPFWTAEIKNLGQLFPLQHDLFDLIIVDEASQVNLAEILPVFYRGKNICIVGDHKQLNLKATGLSFGLTESFDEKIWNKYNGSYLNYQGAEEKFLVVKKASILDFIKSEDYKFPIREVMLEEHFRSLPQLASYTSKTFYKDEANPNNLDGKLKVMTETPDKMALQCFKAILVEGIRDTDNSNKIIIKEAETAVELIKFLTANDANKSSSLTAKFEFPQHIDKSKPFTIGVISIIRDQCEFIKERINDKISEEVREKFKIMVGTPEEFQGSERDIIIFSLCLDENCRGGHGHFQDKQRFNVATSRAKSFTYFIYSKFPLSFDKIHDYLKKMNGGDEFNDQTTEIEIKKLPVFNPENLESEFEKEVHNWLINYIQKRNKSSNSITIHNQITSCGQKRLDFVLFNEINKKSAVLEVDGNYHFNAGGLKQNYTDEHLERMEILERAGWKIINTAYYKWYKNGWLSETTEPVFKEEIERIEKELDLYLFD
jgi:superfamily I DNA and/or RNA helicase/very-short-patch-repair endonuclease